MVKGIGASEGISIAKVYKYEHVVMTIEKTTIEDVDAEIARFKNAIAKSEKELESIKELTKVNINEETAAIFQAHIEILNDPELMNQVSDLIKNEGVNADYALDSVGGQFVALFQSMEDEYFRERAADIKDVVRRVLLHIQEIEVSDLTAINEEVILVAKDLTPSDTAQLNRKLIKGFITDIGGRTSHSAIMARSLEIPAVVGTKNGYEALTTGDLVILDGNEGTILINPDDETIEAYKAKIEVIKKEKEARIKYVNAQSMTKDGHHFEIGANIGSPDDVESTLANGAECIGLYRTEFLYMGSADFPSEDKQFEAYKSVLESMGDKPVVVRTLDIGGDKELNYLPMDQELNPFLGNRAIRLCLDKMDIFKTQLRALIRASEFGNLHIMFPMIATIDELRQAKALLEEMKKELTEENALGGATSYKVGMMIEIPATAILAHVFAKEVDFFSIGTNDLIQYTFAADRMNEKVSYLYQPYNPSILNLIKMVIDAAHAEGKWAGMCGEMAGEIEALPILLGLGLDEFSMSASSILRARQLAADIDLEEAKALALQAITMSTQEEVLQLLESLK